MTIQGAFGLTLQAKIRALAVGIISNSYDISPMGDLEFRAVVGIDAPDALEIKRQTVLPTATKLVNLTAEIDMNTRDTNTLLNLRSNGVTKNLSVVIPAGLTGTFTDPANSDTLVLGDLINYQTIFVGGSGAISIVSASMELTG